MKRAVGRPFQKGQSGNPGGRVALPRDIREALKAEGPAAISRLIALSRMTELLEDPKRAAIFFAANVRLIELTYGKQPEPPGLEEEAQTVESTAAPVERVQPSPKHIAGVLEVLARVGRLPIPGGAGSTGSGTDA